MVRVFLGTRGPRTRRRLACQLALLTVLFTPLIIAILWWLLLPSSPSPPLSRLDLAIRRIETLGGGVQQGSVFLGTENERWVVNLYSGNAPFDDDRLLELVPSLRCFPELELIIDSPDVTNRGVAHLRELQNLQGLALGSPQITDEGLRIVAEFKHLEMLALGGSSVTDAGLPKLYSLPRLQQLFLEGTLVTEEGARAFRKHTQSSSPYVEWSPSSNNGKNTTRPSSAE